MFSWETSYSPVVVRRYQDEDDEEFGYGDFEEDEEADEEYDEELEEGEEGGDLDDYEEYDEDLEEEGEGPRPSRRRGDWE